MEEAKIKHFQCDLHKDELIRKICSNIECPKPLCCIDCILDEQKVHQAHKKSFLSISEYIEYAAEEYKTLKKIRLGSNSPIELTDFLSDEKEALHKLTQHVEEQKDIISKTMDTLIENFTLICRQEKENAYKVLDEQVNILKGNLEHYKNKLQQYYNAGNEPNPTKKDLIEKINQLDGSKELKKLISKIQSDILSRAPDDKKILDNKINELKFQFLDMSKTLKNTLTATPSIKLISTEDENIKLEKSLSEHLTSILKDELRVENPLIQLDMSKIQPLSRIITVEEYNLLMTWLGNKAETSFKLLYRGTKDGFGAKIFHEKVNTLKPTVIIMQSNQGKRFGGYADLDWAGNAGWKNTNATFLFSFNEKEKYNVRLASHAMSALDANGPIFGSDINVCDQCNTKPSSCNFGKVYDNKGKSSLQFAGSANFILQEIEVFQVI